ncbi:MAG: chromosomal replication initiator protein DnaA [Patescibacteria group bacterium]
MELSELWQATLGEIEVEISPPNFHTWFKHTTLKEVNGDTARVAVPSDFIKEKMVNEYRRVVTSVLHKHADHITGVDFVVQTIAPPALQPIVSGPVVSINNTSNTNGRLKSDYTFDNFVVGQSNRFAFAACKNVAENPGKLHNPLYIYGGVGLGKTHLISAIGNHILRNAPKLKISYVSCEDFTNEFIQSLQLKTVDSFKHKYRNVDVFLVDDIQFLARKEGTQEEFFHTFNALHQSNRQIVMTADRMPKAISDLEERLSSRFGMGMVTDIQTPNTETRQAIILAKCAERGITLDGDIVDYVANHVKSNIRELEGALNRIIGYCQLNRLETTLDNAVKALESFVDQNQMKVEPERVVEAICRFFGVSREDLMGKKRSKELVYPRHIAMYLLRNEVNMSYPQIGNLLGDRDHTTIMHGFGVINRGISQSDTLQTEITHLKELITSPNF